MSEFVTASLNLVLASASPRRRDLLAEYGYEAEVLPAEIVESQTTALTVRELVAYNARLKSAALWSQRPMSVVLGVDTLVCLDGKALGKPRDLAEATLMLGSLSGRTHQVFSGVCLAFPSARRVTLFVVETSVTFRTLNPSEIGAYLALINPLDKAGGYAAQEHAELIIASHEGSWTNILGLPMETVARALADRFGVHPRRQGPG